MPRLTLSWLIYAEVLGVLSTVFAVRGITSESLLKAIMLIAMSLALAIMRRCLLLLLQGELLATVNEPIAEETT